MIKAINPRVYRNAARNILNGSDRYACPALGRATNYRIYYRQAYTAAFAELFKPDGMWNGDLWWGNDMKEHREQRALALLLMVQILKSDKKKRKAKR